MTIPPSRTSVRLSGKWADLGPRMASAIALVAVAVLAIWVGGIAFNLFVALAVGVVFWELAQMVQAKWPVLLAILAAGALPVLMLLPAGIGLPLVLVLVLVGIGSARRERLIFALFAVMIVMAGYSLIHLRADFPAIWLVWLVLVVVVTDIAGYFAGRLIGGPKFWPKISPKKTWSGTVAGWIAAALVGVVYVLFFGAQGQIVVVSIAVAMASQMGDIAESALKRRVGVKDSSALLPGHGGFFDRFDGILGASVFLLLVEQIINFPPVVI